MQIFSFRSPKWTGWTLLVLASCAIVLATSVGVETQGTSPIPSSSAGAKAADPAYQGFGAKTPGGSGKAIVRVANLNDSGPGSFRDAVSQGNRTVVFDVGGELVLTKTRRNQGCLHNR